MQNKKARHTYQKIMRCIESNVKSFLILLEELLMTLIKSILSQLDNKKTPGLPYPAFTGLFFCDFFKNIGNHLDGLGFTSLNKSSGSLLVFHLFALFIFLVRA